MAEVMTWFLGFGEYGMCALVQTSMDLRLIAFRECALCTGVWTIMATVDADLNSQVQRR